MRLPRAERRWWSTAAAAGGVSLLMSIPSPVGAQDAPASAANDRVFESVTVTSLGLLLWAVATWLRRQRPESAMHLASSANERAGRPNGDVSSMGERPTKAA